MVDCLKKICFKKDIIFVSIIGVLFFVCVVYIIYINIKHKTKTNQQFTTKGMDIEESADDPDIFNEPIIEEISNSNADVAL